MNDFFTKQVSLILEDGEDHLYIQLHINIEFLRDLFFDFPYNRQYNNINYCHNWQWYEHCISYIVNLSLFRKVNVYILKTVITSNILVNDSSDTYNSLILEDFRNTFCQTSLLCSRKTLNKKVYCFCHSRIWCGLMEMTLT